MSELSQAIAHNIASRPRIPSLAERVFLALNSAADGVGRVRLGIARTAVRAADGIGFLRVRTTEAAIEAHKARVEEAEEAVAPIPKPVRRRWSKALKKMGKVEVRHQLDQGLHLPSTAPFIYADTGLMHGATRYPTRAFVMDWADDAPNVDDSSMRGVMIALIFLVIGAGILLVSFM